jgi:hypothetical protein
MRPTVERSADPGLAICCRSRASRNVDRSVLGRRVDHGLPGDRAVQVALQAEKLANSLFNAAGTPPASDVEEPLRRSLAAPGH